MVELIPLQNKMTFIANIIFSLTILLVCLLSLPKAFEKSAVVLKISSKKIKRFRDSLK